MLHGYDTSLLVEAEVRILRPTVSPTERLVRQIPIVTVVDIDTSDVTVNV